MKLASSLAPALGENRLGVELNPLGGQLAVANRHHDAASDGAALEHVGELVGSATSEW